MADNQTASIALEKKNYQVVDLLKFICAVLVVGIHTNPFKSVFLLDAGFGVLTRCAVPFFFVSSSFFLFSDGLNLKKVSKYLRRVSLLYLIWSLLYIIVSFATSASSDTNVLAFIKNNVLKFLFSGYIHFWYLHASIVGTCVVVLLLLLLKNKKAVFAVCLILLTFGIIFSTYFPIFDSISWMKKVHDSSTLLLIGSTRNGLFYSPVFITIGAILSEYKRKSICISTKKSVIGILISFVLLSIESFFAVIVLKTDETILFFSMIPLTFFLSSFALTVAIKPSPIYGIMRKISILTYCVHPLFIQALLPVFGYGFLLWVGVSLISVLFSLLIYSLSKKRYFSILKALM